VRGIGRHELAHDAWHVVRSDGNDCTGAGFGEGEVE